MHGRRDDAARREIGADIRDVLDAQRQELAVLVERQFRVADMVAVVIVGDHPLDALADPFDRAPDLARRPQGQRVFGEMPAFHAEAAADIAGDDAHLRLGNVEDAPRHIGAGAVRPLRAEIERVAAEPVVILADAAARLHRRRGDAVEDEFLARHMMRLGEGGIDRAPVAQREEETFIVAALVPQFGRALCQGLIRGGDRWQRLVLDGDALGRVLGEIDRLGDDEGDGIADQHRPAVRQRGPRRHEHRRAVAALARDHRAERAVFRGRPIGAGEHREHARHLLRRAHVDRADARMRVGRAQDMGMSEARQVEIVGIAPPPREEPRILGARHRLAQRELHSPASVGVYRTFDRAAARRQWPGRRSGGGRVDLGGDLRAEFDLGLGKIVGNLKAQPDRSGATEIPGEPKRGVRRYGAPPANDLAHARCRQAQRDRQGVRREAARRQFVLQYLSRMRHGSSERSGACDRHR